MPSLPESQRDSPDSFALRLKKSFLFRAQAVFFGRLSINALYCLLFILSLADNTINFGHSPSDAFILLTTFLYAYLSYYLKGHERLGRWVHFITLIFDLLILLYFTRSSGYLLSPLMAIHPFSTAIFLLLFHNPLMIMVPLISIPLSTMLTLWGSNDPSFLSVMYAMMLLCTLDALAIFFIYFVQSQEQRLMQSLIALEKKLKRLAVDQERQRIAREFHDGIGAQLTSIVMQCDLLKKNPDYCAIRDDLNEIQNSAIESIDDMRRSIALLNNNFDIAEQVRILCQNLSIRHKLLVNINHIELLRSLSLEQQLAVCRIVQEALSNVLKHAEANEVSVNATPLKDKLILTIKDNGRGFDTKIRRPNHYGLVNMAARAQQIGGELIMTSLPEGGTKIELAIVL